MPEQAEMKRMNFYVNPDDLDRVAHELGCRPSEAVRRLIDNYLLATEIDEVRQMPGRAPDQIFRKGGRYDLPDIPETVDVEPVE
jgi:hypothetical protein